MYASITMFQNGENMIDVRRNNAVDIDVVIQFNKDVYISIPEASAIELIRKLESVIPVFIPAS